MAKEIFDLYAHPEDIQDRKFGPLILLKQTREEALSAGRGRPSDELEAQMTAESARIIAEFKSILRKSGVNRLFRNDLLEPGLYEGLPFSFYDYAASDYGTSLKLTTDVSHIEFNASNFSGHDFVVKYEYKFQERLKMLVFETQYVYNRHYTGPKITFLGRTGETEEYFENQDALPLLDDFVAEIRQDLTPEGRIYPYR